MSSTVNITDQLPEVTANVVPCKFHYTGPANTEKFWTPTKITERYQNQDVIAGNFRGLKLLGQDVDLRNKIGFVCNESEFLIQNPESSDDIKVCKQYTSIAKFDKFTIFGHDSLPPQNSKWKQLAEWDRISDAIHSGEGGSG